MSGLGWAAGSVTQRTYQGLEKAYALVDQGRYDQALERLHTSGR